VVQIAGGEDGCGWMVDLSARLRERGYDVTAVVAGDGGDTALRLRAAGVPLVALPMTLRSTSGLSYALGRVPRVGRALRVPVDAAAILASSVELARLLRRLDADIAHTHIINAILIGRLAGVLARVPVRVATVPGPYHLEARPTRLLDLATHRLESCLIGGSEAIDRLYRRHGVAPERLRWIPLGTDAAVFDPRTADPARARRELGVPPLAPLIGQVAHFYPKPNGLAAPPHLRGRSLKGHDTMLAAAKLVLEHYPDARFALVGGDWGEAGRTHREEMEQLAAELGVAHAVMFTGLRHDVPDLLAAFDVSVQCSLSENHGGTVESLLMEAPTVATRVGGMPETVRHEETGLLVPPREPEALAAAILRLLDDRELGRLLGRRGRELMLGRFTLDHMVDEVDALYRELAASRKLARRHPRDHDPVRDVVDHDRPGPHDRAVADRHRPPENGADADKAPRADPALTGDVGTDGDVDEVADDAVVVDGRRRVQDRAGTHRRAGAGEAERHQDRSRT